MELRRRFFDPYVQLSFDALLVTTAELLLNHRLGLHKGNVDPVRMSPDRKWLACVSIDYLDIQFRLEKAFGIEIPRKELSPEDILTNADFVKDGKVTPAGIAELKRRMPFVDFAKFESNPQVREFSNLLTVGDLCRYVESKVGAK